MIKGIRKGKCWIYSKVYNRILKKCPHIRSTVEVIHVSRKEKQYTTQGRIVSVSDIEEFLFSYCENLKGFTLVIYLAGNMFDILTDGEQPEGVKKSFRELMIIPLRGAFQKKKVRLEI